MIAKRTGVLADDPALAARVVECLRFVGEDAVLLDREQPELNGVARVVASAPCLQSVPVELPAIQLGGSPDVASRRVAAHLPVPLRLQALLAALYAADAAGDQRDDQAAARMVPDLVGASAAIRRLRGQVAKIADGHSPVLLTGEKGTGQLEVARALHRASPRSREPFVPVDCAAIPADVLESELFGHEKGAFAGALTKKLGRFELAAGGTIFLDSIGAVPLSLQGKLLRAIQHGQIERLGGAELIAVTARIVAAATPELAEMIGAGGFREDLHRALGICTIEVPALRERAEDLPALIAQAASRVEAKHGVTLRLTPEAVNALGAYEWPRNLRELEHIVERLALMHGNELIGIDHLPVKLHAVAESAHDAPTTTSGPGLIDPDRLPLLPVNGLDLRDYLTRLERSLIQQALNDTHHVVARAADRLHIRRTTLVEKMRKYGLSRLERDAIGTGAVARGATQ